MPHLVLAKDGALSGWLEDVNTKTIGMLRVTQAFLPCLARDGSGRVINISGVAGNSGLGCALTRGLNNTAMNQVTRYLTNELAGGRITANAVVPGIVATEWRQAWAENLTRQQGKSKVTIGLQLCSG